MAASLSLSVCQFVRHEGVFLYPRKFQLCFKKSKGCFNKVSRKFQVDFKDRKFQGCFNKVSRLFQG